MKRYFNIAILGFAIGGILAGCGAEESAKTEEKSTNSELQVSEFQNEPTGEQEVKTQPVQLIAEMKEILSKQSEDPRLAESGFDEGFNMYLNAKALNDLIDESIPQEVYASKDFKNLLTLQGFVEHMQFVRTAGLGHNGEAIEAAHLAEQWEPVPEEMREAYEYMNQLLHDLDVAYNKNREGETFGVSYILNGENIEELEKVWNGSGEIQK